MEKEFVPYEQALALKELGFNEECVRGWDKNGTTWCHPDSDIILDNPTFSQAFRWFRENTGLYSIIFYHTDNKVVFKNPHYFRIYEMKHKGKHIEHSEEFKCYEEAEIECLKKLIKLTIK